MSEQFTIDESETGQTLAALVRRHAWTTTWNDARQLITRGKVFVDGKCQVDAATRMRLGQSVRLHPRAPAPVEKPLGEIVYEDSQLVILNKPSGISSVPYETRETGTAMDLIRAHWRTIGRSATTSPLHIVHRIDKETSGLLCFAKTREAERALQQLFRAHDVERTYRCVVHGQLTDRRIESRLVVDRGDGLRGSTRATRQGKRAVTHVRVLDPIGSRATECEVRLETGKTHQIRIHLAENGHPLVGERVYIRDFTKRGGVPIDSPRLLLHAETIGFIHPKTGKKVRWERPVPEDYRQALLRISRR